MGHHKRYIELFAGCGGLSLGLESVGWELELANELSPMAAETFAYNLLGTDIKDKIASPVCNVQDIKNVSIDEWKNLKLAIGDVVQLVEIIEADKKLQSRLKGIDLISGGPPCQGFSMAGKRKERNPKNRLPYAFVDLVRTLEPKTVILENVEGILRPFKSDGGIKEPWLEIAKAFASIGYAPICFLVNAKYFGIPQNRPRFILLGIRKDLKYSVLARLNKTKSHSLNFYSHAFELAEADLEFISGFDGNKDGIQLSLIDMQTYESIEALNEDFQLENLMPEVHDKLISVKEAIDDLKSNGKISSRGNPHVFKNTSGTNYSKSLSESFSSSLNKPGDSKNGIYNHELRKHNNTTRLRFFLIQQAAKQKNGTKKLLEDTIRGKIDPDKSSSLLWDVVRKTKKISSEFNINSTGDLRNVLNEIKSKKHIQRALSPDNPAPAQVTIPDDLCHYYPNQQRVLTVREMARLQSFPDEFVFRSKVTTGGENRKKEVPQYTQVGNAVPPLLGRALGKLLNEILRSDEL